MNYRFLWPAENAQGLEANKARPCVILFVALKDADAAEVLVAPLTHTPQMHNVSLEIPGAYMRGAGLDGRRQFVVCNEVNQFSWPSPNLVPLPHTGSVSGGTLPEGFVKQVRDAFLAERARGNVRSVNHAALDESTIRAYRKRRSL